MSFWLNDSRFIVCMRQIPFLNKILYSTLLPGLVILVWIYFFYLPRTNQIRQLCFNVIDLEKQVSNFKNTLQSIEKEKNLNKKLKIDIDMFSKLTSDFGKISDYLLSVMLKNNISCLSISPLFTKCKQGFKKDYINIVFKCRYADFMEFCKNIKQKNVPLKFCSVKIVRWKDGKIKANIIFRNVSVDCA